MAIIFGVIALILWASLIFIHGVIDRGHADQVFGFVVVAALIASISCELNT